MPLFLFYIYESSLSSHLELQQQNVQLKIFFQADMKVCNVMQTYQYK